MRWCGHFQVERPVLPFEEVVGVAQLVEHRTVAPNVVGSNPIAHPKMPEFPILPSCKAGFLDAQRSLGQIVREDTLRMETAPVIVMGTSHLPT
jgi:hypothetical protein